MRTNGFTDTDALLAIATDDRSFAFRVPAGVRTAQRRDHPARPHRAGGQPGRMAPRGSSRRSGIGNPIRLTVLEC